MRLDLLLAREPFEHIFYTTLGGYLSSQFGWKGDIRWQSAGAANDDGLWVNNKLNLIYSRSIDTNTLRLISSEYAYHPNAMRRLLQWVYVRYTVTRPLRRLFSPSIVVIDPLPSACNNWCILPGNNAIRIIDLKNDECVVLQKDGFDQRYMRDLLQLRHKFPDLPGPKLLRSDIDEGWYAEERIRGLPLNRLDDYHRIQSVQNSAQQSMQSLYDDTSVELDSMKWIQTIFQKD